MKNSNLLNRLLSYSHEKQKPQRFARYAAMLIMLLTLGVGQMWGLSDGSTWYEGNSPYLYFNNINSNYNGVSLVQGRQWGYGSGSAGSQGYAMTAISNTKLYYIHQGLYDHYTTQCFVDRNGGSGWTDWSSTAVASRVTTYAYNYTNSYNLTYTSNKVYVFTAASSSKNASLTKSVDAASGYSSLNKTITVKAKVSTDGGSTYSTATSPGSLSASSKNFSSYNTCGTSTSLSSGTISCGYTATTTLTAADATGYDFVGWYNSSGTQQTTSKTLTIYPTEDATYYAYYKEKRYSLTFSHNGHGSIAVGGNTVASGSTAYVYYINTKTLVASPSTGYNFSGWTKSGSNTGSVTIGNAANASTTIKATNTGATITAGFSAKQTTVTLNGNAPGGQSVTGGGTEVLATYDSSLPLFSALTCDGGYSLTGYWDADDGGNLIINVDGTYADNSGVWDREDGPTLNLYAQWSADPGVSLSAAKTSSINVGETIRLTATGRNAANITRYEFYLGEDLAYTATTSSTTATYDYVVNTTGNKSFTVKMYYNSGSNNITSSAEVLSLNTPTIGLSSSKTSGINVGETVTLTATASYLSPSATNKITYKFYEGSTLKATETVNSLTQTYSYTPTTTGNKTMKVTIDILDMATKTSSNVSLTLNTPSVSLAVKAGSPNNFYLGEGSTILKATPSNVGAGVTPTYVFTDQIDAPYGVTSPSQTDLEWTYNPTASGQAKARTMKVTMTVGGSTYNATVSVTVYEKWTIYVKNNCSWPLGVYYYGYGNGESASWPGTACSVYRGTWYSVVLDNKYPYFILGNGYKDSGKRQLKGSNTHASNIATYPAGSGYTFTYGGKLDGDDNEWYSLTSASLPVAPTVSTNTISTYDVTTATLGGNISSDGGDNITSYGYYYSTDPALSSSNTAAGNRVEVGTGSKSGSYSQSKTGLTAGTTYYVMAYASNGFNTGYGTVRNFTTKVTVNFGTRTGGNAPTVKANDVAISTGASVAKGSEVKFTANKQDGYTFSAWYNHATAGSSVSSDNPYIIASISSNITLYSVFTENKTSITINTDGHGTITTPSPNNSPYSLGVATTQAINATASEGYHWNTWTVSGTAALVSSASTQSNTVKGNGTSGGTGTVTATFSPNTYQVRFHRNGASEATVYQDFTYDVAQNLTANTYTRTGYNFAGWALSTSGAVVYADGDEVSNLTSTNNDTYHLYAKWTAKQSTITLDQTGYGTAGSVTSVTGTYGADMPAITGSGSLPTAPQGYAFMGYYDALEPLGKQYYNANGTSARTWNKNTEDPTTLYAYYKKAEITALVLSPSTQAPGGTVTATPTISPTPAGTTKLCWKILRANGNLLTDDGFSSAGGNAVSFKAPSASGSYKVACVLRTGDACNAGTVLDSVVADLVVAGEHTVIIKYEDGDGLTLAPSIEMTGKPLEWSDAISPATVTGYTFARWDAGDGITITDDGGTTTKTTTTTASIKVKANYEGTLTAVYDKKKMVYFNNTLGWDTVYVYFYNNAAGNKYWADNYGTGANKQQLFSGNRPFYEMHYGGMKRVAPGSNIWYFDWVAEGWSESDISSNITFANKDQAVNVSSGDNSKDYFHNAQVVFRQDYSHRTSLPMFVPLTSVSNDFTKNTGSKYYSNGYWMNYPENTGYTLKIYNSTTYGTSDEMRSIPFEFTADKTMPMSLTVELNANREYGFEIRRADGTVYGQTAVMKNGASGDDGSPWAITASKRTGIQTTVAGEYIFTLNFGNNGGYNYLVGVHYPVAVNDYRVVYKDRVDWSQGSNHSASWYHPSRAIAKKDGATDIVSFYVKKDANTSMKFQYASAVNANTGVVTWNDVAGAGGSINVSSITEDGVYNFYLTQADGAISVSKIEPYEGNYYIRTDCAGSTKWENYRAKDHQMTYSEFSKNRSTNQFGDLYTHYYMHWCPRETNVKFVIANDYSMCITDTLTQDVGNTFNNIDAGGYLLSQKDAGKSEEQDKYSANIRFMYNESTNKICRAYMSSSTEAVRKFLVLRSNSEFTNSDGTALNGTGESSDGTNNIYEAIFQDNQDWIYEREVKVTPSSKFKLYACYAQDDASENGAQYFRGAYASNDWTSSSNYVEIIGGTGSACKVRVVYDYKTNRLMSAYIPEEGTIDGSHAINADIMLVREHQAAGQQLTFKDESSALTEVKTVYGVMRFNRWILNNRQNPNDHAKDHCDSQAHINQYHPLITNPGDLKSSSERGLYWISFPFDVQLSEVFGFGSYGSDWIFMGYNGEARSKDGYWQDSEGFWEYIWDRQDTILKAGHGIVLALDLDRMGATNTSFWANEIQQVELFFPSMSSETGTIKQTDAEVTLAPHQCTIDRRTDEEKAEQEADPSKHDTNKDRTVIDSHWNLLGVPSYANYDGTLKHLYGDKLDSVIVWNTNPETQDLPFLYEWNMNDNTYTVQSGSSYAFKAMHAYYVQFAGKIKWTLASATPASAPNRNPDTPKDVEYRLELRQNEKMIDQTFVRLSNDEEVSAGFVFGEDLSKTLNKGKANIYTFVEGYLPVAGNIMPQSEQTTIIPVGVKLATSGEYTFSIPEGTEGIGITLIDNETGVRTSLSAFDYTVNLNAGTYNDRFVLEISPIHHMPTGIEEVSGERLEVSGVRKLMIDGILYIVKDGKMFDARGARVQ